MKKILALMLAAAILCGIACTASAEILEGKPTAFPLVFESVSEAVSSPANRTVACVCAILELIRLGGETGDITLDRDFKIATDGAAIWVFIPRTGSSSSWYMVPWYYYIEQVNVYTSLAPEDITADTFYDVSGSDVYDALSQLVSE